MAEAEKIYGADGTVYTPSQAEQITSEAYSQWIEQNNRVNPEEILEKNMTAIQQMYDRSSASYGATAEMLRQNGLNNSGLAVFYQGIAEQNKRQSIATENEQYAANERANRADYAAHQQGVQGNLTNYALQTPKAEIDELSQIAMNLYGVDAITARQMAQNAYDATRGNAERVQTEQYQSDVAASTEYVNKLAAQGLDVDMDTLKAFYPNLDEATLQGIVDNARSDNTDAYISRYTSELYSDLSSGAITIDELDVENPDNVKKLAEKYGISEDEAKTMIDQVVSQWNVDKAQKGNDVFLTLWDQYLDGVDLSGMSVESLVTDYGLDEDVAQMVADKINNSAGETIIEGGNGGKGNGYTFTGTDGNEYTIDADAANAFDDLVQNFDKTTEEAIEYIKGNNGEGKKYNFTDEQLAALDAYGAKAKAETDKAVGDLSGAVTSLTDAIISGGDLTSSLMSIRDLDPNLYAALNTADFKNEDGTWNADKMMTGLFDYAKTSGNSALTNNIGNEAVKYSLDGIIKGGGKDDDGKTVYELFTKIAKGAFSDGSTEAIKAQYQQVLNSAVTISADNALHDINESKWNSGKLSNVTITTPEATYTLTLNTHEKNPYNNTLKEEFPNAKNGEMVSYTDKDGRHLYMKVGEEWVWIKKEDGVYDDPINENDNLLNEDWEKLWDALVSVYDKTYEINSHPKIGDGSLTRSIYEDVQSGNRETSDTPTITPQQSVDWFWQEKYGGTGAGTRNPYMP